MGFNYINWLPILIPFIFGLIFFKSFDKGIRYLFYFVSYGVFNELVTRIFPIFFGLKNTHPFSNVYLVISFLFIGLFYAVILEKFIKPRIILFIILGFEVICFFNIFFIQSIFKFPEKTYSLGNIILVIFSIVYFYRIMIEANVKNLWAAPLVWINTGVLIYYSGSLFYTVLFNTILEYSREFSKMTVVYFSAINALFYILIAIGFWKAGKDKSTTIGN